MQHAKTVALCVAIAIAAYFVGASDMEARGPAQPNSIQRVQVEGVPTPQQMLRVVEGVPFTVPDRKVFVVTGLGSTDRDTSVPNNVELRFDGIPVLAASLHTWNSSGTTAGGGPAISLVPPGLVASAGQIIEVNDTTSTPLGVVLGYLASR